MSGIVQKARDRFPEDRSVRRPESLVDVANVSLTVDQHRRGHRGNAKPARAFTVGTPGQWKTRRVPRQETLRIFALFIHVDPQHDEPARTEFVVERIHERERLSTGSAPRRPEVHVDDLAPIPIAQRDAVAVPGGEIACGRPRPR